MPHKQLFFRSEAREKILRGATALADAVRVTLGPKSKCVLIEKKWGSPLVCNDGVTIAKEVELKDPGGEPRGADDPRGRRADRRRGRRRHQRPPPLLAHAIFAEGLRNVVAGASAVDLKRGLDRGLRAAVADAQGALATGGEPQGEGPGRDHLRPQRRGASASWSPTPSRRSAPRESSPSRRPRRPRRRSRSSRGCSSIAATSRRTSSPTRRRWRRCSRIRSSCSPRRRSASMKDLVPLLEQVAQAGAAAADRRRGRRGRGAGDAGRQQDPRRARLRRRQGAGLRRSAQGDARGPRDPDGRPG